MIAEEMRQRLEVLRRDDEISVLLMERLGETL